jgi:hypothetical protein
MRLATRVLMTATLAHALWMLYDGVRCLTTGRFVSRELSEAEARVAGGVVVPLADGTLVEYGPWASLCTSVGVHPNHAAPLFIVLGVVGLAGLLLFFAKRPMGWTLLFVFAVVGLAYLFIGTVLSLIILAMLLLPQTRRTFFGAPEAEVEGMRLERE